MKLKEVVGYIGDEGFEAHRGVIHLGGADFLVFGNDGYSGSDPRAPREVEHVRRHLADEADELGFAVTEDGYSWGLLARFPEEYATDAGQEACRQLLTAALWRGWMGADQPAVGDCFQGVQGRLAKGVIDRIRPQVIELLG